MNSIIYEVYKNTVIKKDGFTPVNSEKNYSRLIFQFTSGDDWEKCNIITACFWQSTDEITKSTAQLLSNKLTATFTIPTEFRGKNGKIYVGIMASYKDSEGKSVTLATNIIQINPCTGAIVKDNAKMDIYENIVTLVETFFENDKALINDLGIKLTLKADKEEIYVYDYSDITGTLPILKVENEDGSLISGYHEYLYATFQKYAQATTTELIECIPGEKFKVSGHARFDLSLALILNKDKKVIGRYGFINKLESGEYEFPKGLDFYGKNRVEITIPLDGAYVIFQAHKNGTENGTLKVEKYVIVRTLKEEVEKQKTSIESINLSVLYGKTMYADGDSILQAPTNGNKSFVHYIAKNNNMTLTCEAKGGTTLAKRIGKTGDSKSIYERIEELTGSYDYIVLDGGGNDLFAKFNFDKPEDAEPTANYIGKVSESYNVNDFDVYTTCGALEAICYRLVTDFTSSKILFVLIHRKNDVTIYDSTNTPIEFHEYTASQREIWSRLKEVLNKWGIPFVDISEKTHLSGWNKTLADKYFIYNENQKQGDGTHPNELGYKQFYVPIIESVLKTL